MSYILDALKKADRARNDGEVTTVELAVENPQRQDNRFRLAMIVVGVNAVIVAALIIYYFLQPVGPMSASPVAVPAPVSESVSTPVETARVDSQPATNSAPETTSLVTPSPAPPNEPPEITAIFEEMEREAAAKEMATVEVETPVTAHQPRPEVEPLIQQVEMKDQELISIVPRPDLPVRPPIVAPATVLPSAPPVATPAVKPQAASTAKAEPQMLEMDIPLLSEKPFPFRQSVPAIVIDIHVYSEMPEKRFVMINMKRRREGDELGGGLKLVNIVPDGVVMIFQGEKFRVNVQ